MNVLHPGAPSWKGALSEAAQRFSLHQWLKPARAPHSGTRARDRLDAGNAVRVELGQPERLWRFSELAAAPAVGIINAGELLRLKVHAPGATLDNTEVRWDEPSAPVVRRLPPPELAWFHAFCLPDCRGEGARAEVARGTVMIELPKCTLGHAVWEPAAPSPPSLRSE